jgi:hypothetical protein
MARGNVPTWILAIGGLLLADRVLGLFSNPQDPATNPYTAPDGSPPAQWTTAQVRAAADGIEAAIWGTWDWSEDEQAVIGILTAVPTERDLVALINTYGLRGGFILGGDGLTLPATVTAYLSSGERATVNAALSAKGIQFQF